MQQAMPSTAASADDAATPREHPFAAYLRTVGKGEKLSRPLSQDEAAEAMRMILAGRVEPVQLGAFLIVLRYRKETPAELAGFASAAREHLALRGRLEVELDWPSYADKHKQLPYFVLAALLLAQSGVRVLMHGIAGDGPAGTPAAVAALGIEPATSLDAAARGLETSNLAYMPLAALCPALNPLFDLKPLLGLRSPANTYARELNPFAAPHQIQGVFHPNYAPLHQEAARLLGQPNAAIFKGGGGEVQRNPKKACKVATLAAGEPGSEEWPALLPEDEHPWRDEPLDPVRVAALWRGDMTAPGPEAAVIGTAAIALKLLGRADGIKAAESQARELWNSRDHRRFAG